MLIFILRSEDIKLNFCNTRNFPILSLITEFQIIMSSLHKID